jgi:hypothetical protein
MAQTFNARFVSTYGHKRALYIEKPCGHTRHVGQCASCQRVQLARWDAQLAEASRARVR